MPQNGAIRSLNYLFCNLETLNWQSNQKRRRMFIQAHLAIACKPCLKSVRYLVLLFLVWKPYWNIAASTLLRFFRSSNGMDSTLRLTSALSTCSFLKYLYDFLPSAFSRTIHGGGGVVPTTPPYHSESRRRLHLRL